MNLSKQCPEICTLRDLDLMPVLNACWCISYHIIDMFSYPSMYIKQTLRPCFDFGISHPRITCSKPCFDFGISYPRITNSVWEFSCIIESREFDFCSLIDVNILWFDRITYFTCEVIYLILTKWFEGWIWCFILDF